MTRTAVDKGASVMTPLSWPRRSSRLGFGALVGGGLGGIFLSQTLSTLPELSYPLPRNTLRMAQGLPYLGQFPHPKDEHENDQDDEEFWQAHP